MKRKTETVRVADLTSEPGAKELALSPAMQPYLALSIALVGGQDVTPHLKRIAALPLHERYLWRVTSALKHALCDYDSVNVDADLSTFSAADLEAVTEYLPIRLYQLCSLLKTLFDESAMEEMVLAAVQAAKRSPAPDVSAKLAPKPAEESQ
jgi:hypothetical protein